MSDIWATSPKDWVNDLYWRPYSFNLVMGVLSFLKEAPEEKIEEFLRILTPGSVRDTRCLLCIWSPLKDTYSDHPSIKEIEMVLRSRLPRDPLVAAFEMLPHRFV